MKVYGIKELSKLHEACLEQIYAKNYNFMANSCQFNLLDLVASLQIGKRKLVISYSVYNYLLNNSDPINKISLNSKTLAEDVEKYFVKPYAKMAVIKYANSHVALSNNFLKPT